MNYNDLRDNIKNISVDELKKMLNQYNRDIITEQRFEIIKLIVYELEYRRLSKYINSNVDLKILLDYNYDVLWKISDNEIGNSIKFLNNNNIKIENLIRWIPICLSMSVVYYIYVKMKNEGFSLEKIFDCLISDIKLNLVGEVKNINNDYLNDKEFIKFIEFVFNNINLKFKNTDIYKKMMSDIIKENDYVLKNVK